MVNYSGLSFWPFCCHVTHTEAVRKIAAKRSAAMQSGQAAIKGMHCNANAFCILLHDRRTASLVGEMSLNVESVTQIVY